MVNYIASVLIVLFPNAYKSQLYFRTNNRAKYFY